MKILKILSAFVIFYFVVTVIDTVISLGEWVSRGNDYLLMGYYTLLVILVVAYLLIPLLSYLRKPTVKRYKQALDGDEKSLKKIVKYLRKHHIIITPDEDLKEVIIEYLKTQSSQFKKISKSYALKVSSVVMLSPNSFIDGLTILLSNSKMIYELSNMVMIRYTWKEVFQMYFSTLTVASVTGLIEEFDDAVIEAFEELLEEMGEKLGEEAGKAISSSIPFVKVAAKSMSFIVQSSLNYAFVIYNGRKFYYMVESIYESHDAKSVQQLARKEARWSRVDYMKQLSEQIKKKVTPKKRDDQKKFFGKNKNESLE